MTSLGQLASYGWIGVVTAIAHYGLMIGLVEAGGVRAVPASLAGFALGAAVSYSLNRWLTFRSTRGHGAAGWRFGIVAFGGFLATWALMSLLVERLGLPYLAAQVLTTACVMAFSFTAHKFWSFAERH